MTKLKTPGGRSASATHSASAMPATAVVDAGVHTTVFPAASAGAISSAGIVYGQFHGVITPMTPRGRRTSSTRFRADTELASRPSSRLPSSAALRQYGDELLHLVARLRERLALVERERVHERRAPLLHLVGDAVQHGRALERAERRAHAGAASFAAAIARCASSRPPFWIDADLRAGDRRLRVERLARERLCPRAVDEHQSPSSVRRRSTYAFSSASSSASIGGFSYSSSVFFQMSVARVAVSRPPFRFQRS